MKNYPEQATERFDNANFHINYCLYFIKKFVGQTVLEVGAGCGSFSKYYIKDRNKIVMTELDKKNLKDLKNKFRKNKNVVVKKGSINKINSKFDSILYLHVLEHIKDHMSELNEAKKRLNRNGHLIIMVPSDPKMYSKLDKAVGHYRRYEKSFFKKDLKGLKRQKIMSLDIMGYWLYFLNKIFFKEEVFPSNFKIFIWDKIFTPFTVIMDFLTNYKFGKCILAVYKKE